MSNLMERLDNLRTLIQDPAFLEGKGLSNEVNIRIFCYDPKEEMAVRYFIEKLTTDPTLECHLIECNLYKIFPYKPPYRNLITKRRAISNPPSILSHISVMS
jgi:hypothetical protein